MRLLLIPFALAAIFSLAACSSNDDFIDPDEIKEATEELREDIREASEAADEAMENQDEYFSDRKQPTTDSE